MSFTDFFKNNLGTGLTALIVGCATYFGGNYYESSKPSIKTEVYDVHNEFLGNNNKYELTRIKTNQGVYFSFIDESGKLQVIKYDGNNSPVVQEQGVHELDASYKQAKSDGPFLAVRGLEVSLSPVTGTARVKVRKKD